MATSVLSEELLQCSICLEVFSDPVSLPCGHNFCRCCISRHWQEQQQWRCPLCSHTFSKALKLQVNHGLREIVENFKKLSGSDLMVRAGEVPCDHCFGIKLRALKTCLSCMGSYCETHLEPHRHHSLTDPVKNRADICKKHNRTLDRFCKDHLTRCCDLCPEHRRHRTVNLEEEYWEKKSLLEKEKLEVDKMIYDRTRLMKEIEEAAQTSRKDRDEALASNAQTFSLFVASIESRLMRLQKAIEEKQRGAERQAEILLQELKKEIAHLQRRGNKLQNISQSEDPVQLIKGFHSLSSSAPNTKRWFSISLHSRSGAEAVSKALLQLEEAIAQELKKAGGDFRTCCVQILHEESERIPSQMVIDLGSVPEGIRLDVIRQQYEVDVTFDPHSANDLLVFSRDFKEVRTPHIWWWANQVPHRFNSYAFTLGSRAFSHGRFYYEVKTEMKSDWDLGVVRESVRGKKQFTPSTRDGGWVIRLRNNTKLEALHHKALNIPLTKKPERVGVFVDYEGGLVSFYDVDTSSLIYSFTGCSFNEKIFPFFSPGPSDDGINGAPLVLSSSPSFPPAKDWKENLEQYLQKEAGRFCQQAWRHPIDGLFWLLSFLVIGVVVLCALKSPAR